jgi:hypothetical protein
VPHVRIGVILSSFLALANFMRLSLMKAAHADVVAPRAGNPDTWAENDGRSPTIGHNFVANPDLPKRIQLGLPR